MMHRTLRLTLSVLAASLLAAPEPGFAQTAPAGTASDAVAALVRQATFWGGRGDITQAQASLRRALQVDPTNAEALALAAELTKPAPDVEGAKSLAAAGKFAAAVAAYQTAFGGTTPPPLLALPYFRALGQTASGWQAARDGLAELVRHDPAALDAQLAYAEILTARAGDARADGLARLQALAATPQTAIAARLAAARALLADGQAAAATHMLAAVPESGLTEPQVAAREGLLVALAVRQADALNAAGRQSDAFAALAPLLAATPDDANLTLALGRLYLAAQRPRDALATDERVLQADPANAAAHQQAVDAALAAGQRARAGALVQDALRRTPRSARAWLAAAALARAAGDPVTALQNVRHAQALHQHSVEPPAAETATAAPRDNPAATVLATLAPGDLSPGDLAPGDLAAPPAAVVSPQSAADDSDDDPDPVVIRGHMLDTDATELLPPEVLRARAAAAAPTPAQPAPFAARQVSSDPTLRAASTDGDAPAPANPFPAPPPGAAAPTQLAQDVAGALDPVGARIDSDIAALKPPEPPSFQASIGVRGRSGTPGLGQLGELTVPMQATFPSGGDGQMGVAVTPTFLTAGSVPGGVGSQSQFGTVALTPGGGAYAPVIKRQTASGTGLDVSFAIASFAADVGATPLGFQQENVVGGLTWAPEIAQGVRLRVTGERRAVTDSLLSYGGTRDPISGTSWGGVTRSGGRLAIEYTAGPLSLYAGGGGYVLQGEHVQQNTEAQGGVGGSYGLLQSETQQLRAGLDLIYFGYQHNLSGFSLGQGGYFSPQSYFAAMLPVNLRQSLSNALTVEIGGSAGVQTYHQQSAPYYPIDPGLQARLQTLTNPATAVPGVASSLASLNRIGFSGGAHGSLDYAVTPSFHIGAQLEYQHTGNWNEALGLLYGRYRLGNP